MRRLVVVLGAVAFLALALVAASAILDQPHRYYRDAVVVEASRERIWSLLTEFDGYDEWNPYYTRASGNAAVGTTLELRAAPPGEDAEELSAELVIVRPRRKLEWKTRTLVPGRARPRADLPRHPGRARTGSGSSRRRASRACWRRSSTSTTSTAGSRGWCRRSPTAPPRASH